jgi:hypothetical protein
VDSADEGGGAAGEAPAAEWSAEEAVARLEEGLARGLPSPLDMRARYIELMDHTETECPRRENIGASGATGVWYDDCDTSEGYHFQGFSNYDESSSDVEWSYSAVMSCQVEGPDGSWLQGAGEYEYNRQDSSDGLTWDLRIGGIFSMSGAEGWLAGDGEAGLYASGALHGEERSLQLDGGVSWTDVDAAFHELRLDPAVCADQPLGQISVRDPLGQWYWVRLEDCSGCGRIEFAGEDVGEACLGVALMEALPTFAALMEG